jgi:hypothetical protein
LISWEIRFPLPVARCPGLRIAHCALRIAAI